MVICHRNYKFTEVQRQRLVVEAVLSIFKLYEQAGIGAYRVQSSLKSHVTLTRLGKVISK